MNRLAGALILFVSLAACAPAGQADHSTTPTTTQIPTTATTTTQPPTTTTQPATSGVPVLEDGRPATFLAVTTDYEAVEVDTASGAVIRSLGQISTRQDVDNAECPACVNAIDAVWRTHDGSSLLISECCEPAAGRIHQFPADAAPLTRDHADAEVHQFWSATPSPISDDIAFVGYFLQVTGPGSDEAPPIDLFDRFAITNASWGRDGTTVMWLELDGDAVILRSLDISSARESEVALDFATGWQLTGLTTRATGELLSIRFTTEGEGATGVVFTPEGALVAEFDLEDGSRLGGYDQTGTFLAYTDGAGVARWMGEGLTGQLGSGFLFVSW